jgi:molybdopterin synthase catalytic subunit
VAVILRDADFSPYRELEAYQQAALSAGQYGATAVFVGTMRDLNLGESVERMSLEHYPGMTERRLAQIAAEASARWGLLDALVVHRVGEVRPNDSIVLVAAWAAHRGAALDACRHIIEALKHSAPFWKKEILARGERWVESNTGGY